jgi:hypothetical protein
MAKIKKAQRGGCLSTTGSGARLRIFKQAAGEGRSGGDNNRAARQYARNDRRIDKAKAKMEREEAKEAAKAAAANAPKGKSGLKVKKAQAGKMVPSEMKPGKMIKKADRDARADKMVNALDKQARKGSSARPMGANLDKKSFDKVPSLDKLKKKIEKKKSGGTVSSQLGSYKNVIGKNTKGKATKAVGLTKANYGKSMGKCKYGC